MPATSIREVIQTLLQPLVTRELRWETAKEVPEMSIIFRLENEYGGQTIDTAEGDTTQERWRVTNHYGLVKHNITFTSTKQVRVTRQVPWYTRFILLAAFFFGLERTLDGSFAAINTGFWFYHFIIPFAVTGWSDSSPPIPACTELAMEKHHPLPTSIVIVGAGIYTIQVVTSLSVLSAHVSAMVILGAGIILIRMWFRFIEIEFPFRNTDDKITGENEEGENEEGENEETVKIFNIPVTMCIGMFVVSCVSIPFIILTGIIGGAAPPEETAVTTDSYVLVVPIAVGITTLFFISFLSQSTQVCRDLGHAKLRPFKSSRYRFIAAFLFIAPNILFFGIGTIILGVLVYGVTGDVYAPTYLLAPLINSVFGSADVSVPEFLQATYVATDSTFQAAPVGPPRVYSLAYLATLSWPFLFIVIGTIAGTLRRPYKLLSILARSRPIKPDSRQQMLTDDIGDNINDIDDIEIRRIDRGADVTQFRFLFGWRKYIVISDVIIDRLHTGDLRSKEFEAIVRHEEYHLRERHYSILAACLGPFLGGRNALLVFKDYRASEDQADDHAIIHTSQDALSNGIDQVYKESTGNTNPSEVILSANPGVVRREAIDDLFTFDDSSGDNSDNDDDRLLARASKWLNSRLRMTYYLYFGAILVETAHRSPDKRFDRLKNEDDN